MQSVSQPAPPAGADPRALVREVLSRHADVKHVVTDPVTATGVATFERRSTSDEPTSLR